MLALGADGKGTTLSSMELAMTADVSGDGATDLLWQNESSGAGSAWLMSAGVALDYLNFSRPSPGLLLGTSR